MAVYELNQKHISPNWVTCRWFWPTVKHLRGSLPKSGPLDFATKNTFLLFFFGEEALVGVY